MATQEAPGGSNPPELGWVFRRHFDRPGPIYFWSAAGLKIARGPQWPLNDRYSGRYKGGGSDFSQFSQKVGPMGSKGSRRGPLKTLPIKSYSVQEMAHSSGFGVMIL